MVIRAHNSWNLYFSSRKPGKAWMTYSNIEMSIRLDQHPFFKSSPLLDAQFSADSREYFCSFSRLPGKSWIFSSNAEISIESEKYQAVKSQIDRAFQLYFEYNSRATRDHASSSLALPWRVLQIILRQLSRLVLSVLFLPENTAKLEVRL
jgi:hypothetical protein